jgi:hypothetical protein
MTNKYARILGRAAMGTPYVRTSCKGIELSPDDIAEGFLVT